MVVDGGDKRDKDKGDKQLTGPTRHATYHATGHVTTLISRQNSESSLAADRHLFFSTVRQP